MATLRIESAGPGSNSVHVIDSDRQNQNGGPFVVAAYVLLSQADSIWADYLEMGTTQSNKQIDKGTLIEYVTQRFDHIDQAEFLKISAELELALTPREVSDLWKAYFKPKPVVACKNCQTDVEPDTDTYDDALCECCGYALSHLGPAIIEAIKAKRKTGLMNSTTDPRMFNLGLVAAIDTIKALLPKIES